MEIKFQQAKNGEKTACVGNLYLHSTYNPGKEAQRFVENLQLQVNYKYIIVTEPALSYLGQALKNKFPNIKIGAIRYTKDFNDFNSVFDFVINAYENFENFDSYLLNKLGEENLLETYFLYWEPSAKIFPEINKKIWQDIKKSIENAKTLLITRQYFEKKWIKNTFKLVSNLKNTIILKEKINAPVIIIASGSSLKPFLQLIKNNQKKFFIIVLSSATRVCLENEINPDLILSTDGGFWAGQHLKILSKHTEIPLGLSAEAFASTNLLTKNSILPFYYSDGISKKIFDLVQVPSLELERNGTISGSALDFALAYSSNEIYFFGLDLSTCKGFQHAQINELELNSCIFDNKINSSEKRSVKSQFSNTSLDIYKDWFANKNINQRKVYRVIEKNQRKNQLGQIKDIDYEVFSKKCENYKEVSKENYFKKTDFHNEKQILNNYLKNDFCQEDVKKQLYPLDYVLQFHENNTEIKDKIENNHKKLCEKIWRIING